MKNKSGRGGGFAHAARLCVLAGAHKDILTMTDTLILASASPRRKHLLEQAGLRFAVDPARVEEHEDPASCPLDTVLHNARLKATDVSARRPEALVLGSDTVVALEDEVLQSPPTWTRPAPCSAASADAPTRFTPACACSDPASTSAMP